MPPRSAKPSLLTVLSSVSPNPTIHRCLLRLLREVKRHFDHPDIDASHDFHHVLRVLKLSHSLSRHGLYDKLTVTLGALMHDVGDRKYSFHHHHRRGNPVANLLRRCRFPEEIVITISDLVAAVSYSHERTHPRRVRETIRRIPETAVVQDADRLDALGAVGLGRAFTYAAAAASSSPSKGRKDLNAAVYHCYEKLFRLQGMMKTHAGRREAGRRMRIMRQFVREWMREISF